MKRVQTEPSVNLGTYKAGTSKMDQACVPCTRDKEMNRIGYLPLRGTRFIGKDKLLHNLL